MEVAILSIGAFVLIMFLAGGILVLLTVVREIGRKRKARSSPPLCDICSTALETEGDVRCRRCEQARLFELGLNAREKTLQDNLDEQRRTKVKALRNIAAGKPAKPPPRSWYKRLLEEDEL